MTDGINWTGLSAAEYREYLEKKVKEKFKNDNELFREVKLSNIEADDWTKFAETISTNNTKDAKVDSDDTDAEKEEKGFLQFLLKLFSADVIIDEFDENGNKKLDKGEVSADELKKFVETKIASMDGLADDISVDDFAKYLQKFGVNLETDKAETPEGNNNPPPNNPSDPKDETTTTTLDWAKKSGAELSTNIQTADMQLNALLYSSSGSLTKTIDGTSKTYGSSFDMADETKLKAMNDAAKDKETKKTELNKLVDSYNGADDNVKARLHAYTGLIEQHAQVDEQIQGLKIVAAETESQLNHITTSKEELQKGYDALKHVKVPGKTKEVDDGNGGKKEVPNHDAYYAAIKRNKEIDKQKAEISAQLAELKAEEEKVTKEQETIKKAQEGLDAQKTALDEQIKKEEEAIKKEGGVAQKFLDEHKTKVKEYKDACTDYNKKKADVMQSIADNLKAAREKEKDEIEAKAEEAKKAEETNKKIEEAYAAEEGKLTAEEKELRKKYDVPAEPKELRDSLDAYAIASETDGNGDYQGDMAFLNDENTRNEIIRQYGSVYNYLNVVSLYGTKNDNGTELADSPHLEIYKEGIQPSAGYTEAELDQMEPATIRALLDEKSKTYVENGNDRKYIQAYLHTQLLEEGEEDAEFIILAEANGWIDADGEATDTAWKIEITTAEEGGEKTEKTIDATAVDNFFNQTGFDSILEDKIDKIDAKIKWIQKEQEMSEKEDENWLNMTTDTDKTVTRTLGIPEGKTAGDIKDTIGLGIDELETHNTNLNDTLTNLQAELAFLMGQKDKLKEETEEELETTVD